MADNVITDLIKEGEKLNRQFVERLDIIPTRRIITERVALLHGQTVVTSALQNSNYIQVNHPTTGVVNDTTYKTIPNNASDVTSGSEIIRVLNKDDTFKERFLHTTFNNTAVTTANVVSSDSKCYFDSGEVYRTTITSKNEFPYNTAVLSIKGLATSNLSASIAFDGAGSGSASTLDNSLIHYYDADSSTAFTDNVGSSDGTITDATFAAGSGISNGCYNFAGGTNDDKVVVANLNSTTGAASVSLWGKSDTLQTNTDYNLLFRWSDSGSDALTLYFSGYGDDNVRARAHGAGGITTINYAATLSTSWHHYVLTLLEGGNLKLYVDGNLAASGVAQSDSYLNSNQDFVIGNRAAAFGGNETFDGLIDEVGVWTRELAASDVTELYNSGTGKFYPYDALVNPTFTSITPDLLLQVTNASSAGIVLHFLASSDADGSNTYLTDFSNIYSYRQ